MRARVSRAYLHASRCFRVAMLIRERPDRRRRLSLDGLLARNVRDSSFDRTEIKDVRLVGHERQARFTFSLSPLPLSLFLRKNSTTIQP